MGLTLIIDFCVGVFFAQARLALGETLDKAGLRLADEPLTLVTFAICLAAASAFLSLLGVQAYPVLLCLGAAIGVARKPLLARMTQRRR